MEDKASSRGEMDAAAFRIDGLDHVQIAAPPQCEDAARAFYGRLLGMEEIEKPASLKARGGVWFRCGSQQLHVGVQPDFIPARKAHPAFRVRGLDALRQRLQAEGHRVQDDDALPGVRRFYVDDPFGNRLEFMES